MAFSVDILSGGRLKLELQNLFFHSPLRCCESRNRRSGHVTSARGIVLFSQTFAGKFPKMVMRKQLQQDLFCLWFLHPTRQGVRGPFFSRRSPGTEREGDVPADFISVTDTPGLACFPWTDVSLSKAALAAEMISKSFPLAGTKQQGGRLPFSPFDGWKCWKSRLPSEKQYL